MNPYSDDRYIRNEQGKVLYFDGISGKAHPYRWYPNYQRWEECSGKYSLSYIAQLKRMGLVKFFFDR